MSVCRVSGTLLDRQWESAKVLKQKRKVRSGLSFGKVFLE